MANFGHNPIMLVGLETPEPLANLYSRSYFRATWVTTALDAGFWTAMRIKRTWLRDIASIIFTGYYLIAAEQADEKVRKVRGTLTVDHLRVSWNKGTTPYLLALNQFMRPKLTRYSPRAIRIPRPPESSYKDPVIAWLYFDGPLSELGRQTNVVLDIPGGGFVAMNPRTSDDKLLAWAGKTGLPVLSLDYKKAPEYPYPYALNECYDVYRTIIASRGRCLGLSGDTVPRVVLTGDSAGGNLATGVVLMVLQSAGSDARRRHGEKVLPVPDGLILMYPALDCNIGNWMTDEQMALIQDRQMRKTNKNILRRKSDDYYSLRPETPHPSEDEAEAALARPKFTEVLTKSPSSPLDPDTSLSRSHPTSLPDRKESISREVAEQTEAVVSSKPRVLRTRLAMSSMISYFNDRILTPEMMRAMIILYVGPHYRPDFSTDFLLSPVLAPEALLARFPKTYFLTGERDPLVDDTVIMAGRVRQAKFNNFRERQDLGLEKASSHFDEKDHVQVTLIPGISHGFVQFVGVFPEGWKHIYRCGRWIKDIFEDHPDARLGESEPASLEPVGTRQMQQRYHRRKFEESSADEDHPLEMSSIRPNDQQTSPRGRRGRPSIRARRAQNDRRRGSLVSLASEEDLLGRRMNGLASGLLGMTPENAITP
ncbi:MAG: hypothetical protein M1834_003205 [Cirrosporium novae-zelandiae]|nr:MAG: hypothetical protein M1834_003205 [Cirrosporium novae-zelandiae]